MKMILLSAVCILATQASTIVIAKDVKADDEFIKYNDQGEVILQGKYTRDETGKVIRYDVFDVDGSLQYYEIPYYRADGSIIRGDTYSAEGQLIRIAVFFESTVKVYDKDGNHLPEFDSSFKEL